MRSLHRGKLAIGASDDSQLIESVLFAVERERMPRYSGIKMIDVYRCGRTPWLGCQANSGTKKGRYALTAITVAIE